MADSTVASLTAASVLDGTELLYGVQGGADRKVTAAQIKTFTSASPTLVTPVLGVATATSVNKLTITAPATGSTLTIADGKTLTASNSLTFTGTDATSIAFAPVKGNILIGNGTNFINLGVGTNTHVLTADSAEASGVKWAAGGGGGGDDLSAIAEHLIFTADNTWDIGEVAAPRPRNVYVGTNVIAGNFVRGAEFHATSFWYGFGTSGSRGWLNAPSDGVFTLFDTATTSFNRLQFGGVSSSFPALKRSTTILQSRLADDSAFAPLQGILRVHANAAAETPTATHTMRIFDAAGTEYKVLCIAA